MTDLPTPARKHRAQPSPRDGRTNTAIRFKPEVYAALAKAAEEREVSMNWIVNRAVVDYIDRLLPPEEVKWTR
jgi:predicted HicB family RNase H-like nuclease